jgi:tRNA (guanine-N(7)-)-methyltransferase subunit TRM82
MPKRPCAIALTSDQETIICADKFGDVYSLPLLVSDSSLNSHIVVEVDIPRGNAAEELKPFISTANNLTVHSARNRRALQNQMKQKQKVRENLEIPFEHELILGHVSMLTDIALVEHEGRNYIVTSDRDEHIRISRGIPQAHIIEGFCLGHKDFVSRLCFPSTKPTLLVSGGGDDEIYVWSWLCGELTCKINIRDHVEAVLPSLMTPMDVDLIDNSSEKPSDIAKIAVSNIRHIRAGKDSPEDFIVITCEG